MTQKLIFLPILLLGTVFFFIARENIFNGLFFRSSFSSIFGDVIFLPDTYDPPLLDFDHISMFKNENDEAKSSNCDKDKNVNELTKIRNKLSSDIKKLQANTPTTTPYGISSNEFAYVTVVAVPSELQRSDNTVNISETSSANDWCQSIRTSHDLLANYDIVAIFAYSSSSNVNSEKFHCFDKLLFVDESLINDINNMEALRPGASSSSGQVSIDSSVISKLWIFSLVQYKRIIFMKPNLAPVHSAVYNYFFKDYYLTSGDGPDNKNIATPKKMYSQSSKLSPINTDFLSLEPNIDTAVDLLSIYALGKWDVNNGWLCYGPFDFDPLSRMESFEDLLNPTNQQKPYQLNRKKEVHAWREFSWSFDASWSDTGLLFYYHYLKHPESSGLIDEWFDYSVIEHVSILISNRSVCIPSHVLTHQNLQYIYIYIYRFQSWRC